MKKALCVPFEKSGWLEIKKIFVPVVSQKDPWISLKSGCYLENFQGGGIMKMAIKRYTNW